MSSPLTFTNIKPLVQSAEVQRVHLYVTFKCPVTGAEIVSTSRIADMTPAGGHAQSSGHDFDRFRDGMAKGISALAGERNMPFFGVPHADLHGPDGKLIEDAEKLDRDIYEHGVVRAFEAVSQRFRWDADSKRYVSAG